MYYVLNSLVKPLVLVIFFGHHKDLNLLFPGSWNEITGAYSFMTFLFE